MANLDIRIKRASSVQILTTYILAPVYPNGMITAPDRQQQAWTYANIAEPISASRMIDIGYEDRIIIVNRVA